MAHDNDDDDYDATAALLLCVCVCVCSFEANLGHLTSNAIILHLAYITYIAIQDDELFHLLYSPWLLHDADDSVSRVHLSPDPHGIRRLLVITLCSLE